MYCSQHQLLVNLIDYAVQEEPFTWQKTWYIHTKHLCLENMKLSQEMFYMKLFLFRLGVLIKNMMNNLCSFPKCDYCTQNTNFMFMCTNILRLTGITLTLDLLKSLFCFYYFIISVKFYCGTEVFRNMFGIVKKY